MKKLIIGAIALAAGLVAFTSPMKEETYRVDTEKSTIDWSAKKVGGGHTGTIKISQGTVVMNGRSVVKGTFLIDMSSVTSDNARVTAHLKSNDFFGAEKFPTSKFEITRVRNAGQDRVDVSGNLTIRGITHPLTFPATVKQQGDVVVAVAKGIRVDRTKYEMKFRSKTFFIDIGDRAVDDEFELNINLVARKQQSGV